MEEALTFTLLRDGHAEPVQVQTVLAADAGAAAAERMERDGPHDQWKLQRQLWGARNVHTYLTNERWCNIKQLKAQVNSASFIS